MADEEKVIKELQRMADVINQYDDMLSVDNVDSWVILASLALLKEHEHERLKVNIRHRNNDGYCPSCGKCIVMDFCPNNCGFCGQAVKWEC